MRNRLVIAIIITLTTFSSAINAQNQINSPYSRFNLGTIEPSGSYRSQSMGGIGTAMRNNSSIYFSNPSSYSSIDTNSFVFDFGLQYNSTELSGNSTTYSSNDFYFDHLIMGFPIAKGLGFSVGVIPFSNGYYNLEDAVTSADPEYNPVTGEYTEYHKGDGGIYKVYAGTGLRLNKNFSIGVNLTYMVGQLTRSNLFDFADFYNSFHDESSEVLKLGGMNFEYGIQYTGALKNDYFFNAGVSLTPSKKYTTTYNQISYRYNAYGSVDTLVYTSDKSKSSVIPATLRAGIAIGKTNKFVAGADFIYSQWSKSTIPGSAGYMTDTKSLRIGAEFIPDKYSNYSLLKRIEYRAGAHIGNNYLFISGEKIKEIGASAGFGLPLRKSHSQATMFIDYTKKYGTSASDLHTENVITIGISLNLYDGRWFLQRKYD